MKKPILKAYYRDIFFEFLTHEEEKEAIILLSGFPSSNSMDDKMYFLYEKGFNVFFPRYKGTFQSKGKFLKSNPIDDLKDFVAELKKETAVSLWDMKSIKFKNSRIFVFGGSFGGSIACALAASCEDIAKAVIVSPVWDFNNHNKEYKEQGLSHLTKFIKRAFLNLYRYDFDDLTKQAEKIKEMSFDFYKKHLLTPVLVFHDPNDSNVSIEHSRKAKDLIKQVKLIETNTGHGLNIQLLEQFFSQIEGFLKAD